MFYNINQTIQMATFYPFVQVKKEGEWLSLPNLEAQTFVCL